MPRPIHCLVAIALRVASHLALVVHSIIAFCEQSSIDTVHSVDKQTDREYVIERVVWLV